MSKLFGYARLNPSLRKKRKVLKKAEKEIDRLESMKTERTKDVERRTGAQSDIEKRKREVARRARQTLMGSKGK